jgi:preprotein translocase subunit YajC
MGNSYSSLMLIALMVVAFYFLILRPQKKRQQAHQKTMTSLAPGTRVLLGSGIFGTITAIGDKQAVVELSPGVELTVLKQSIVRTVQEGDEDTEWDSSDDEPDAFDDRREADVIEPQGVDPKTLEVQSDAGNPTFDAPAGNNPTDPDPGNSPSNKG